MKDSNKLYYLDRNPDSKRNIPFDTNFRLLYVKGLGTSVCHQIGSYEFNKWLQKNTQEELHPYAWSYLTKYIPESK